MKILFRITLSVFLVATISTISFAQETESGNRPITKSGSAGWLFGFGGLSTMSMPGVELAELIFPGEETDKIPVMAAGGKYYLSDGLAVRALIAFSTQTEGADTLKNGKTSGTIFGIGAGIEMHTHDVYAISPYFGGQISFASASSTNTTKVAGTSNDTKVSASGFGVGVMAGFDWYVFQAVAIGAEYTLSFGSASASSTESGTTKDEPSVTSIGIGSASIHLLIHM